MEDIRLNGGVLYDAIQHITPEAVKGSGLFEPYSIILATTATIGEHAMIIADSLANQQFTNFKVRKSLSHRYDPYYLYYYFFRIDEWCLKNTNAGGLLSVDIPSLKRKTIYAPLLDEQTKIVKLLRLIDERIATQNKIIERYESLIRGIAQHCIKESTSGKTYVKLGDICQITTGKLDANAQVDNGIYPFFTCAEQPFKINSFAFDTEALLISGNGANLGYINYYKGKFNAYQRTYVLDLFSENIQYIKWALKVLLPKRIAIEKSSSNTPYIVLSTLTDLRLPIPCKSKQSFIANLMQSLERKLSNQIAQYDSYNYLKQYLLRQMFI